MSEYYNAEYIFDKVMPYIKIKVKKSVMKTESLFHVSYIIREGYHSFGNLETAQFWGNCDSLVIRKFVIPKGTKYYEANHGLGYGGFYSNEIVSERIKMVR